MKTTELENVMLLLANVEMHDDLTDMEKEAVVTARRIVRQEWQIQEDLHKPQ